MIFLSLIRHLKKQALPVVGMTIALVGVLLTQAPVAQAAISPPPNPIDGGQYLTSYLAGTAIACGGGTYTRYMKYVSGPDLTAWAPAVAAVPALGTYPGFSPFMTTNKRNLSFTPYTGYWVCNGTTFRSNSNQHLGIVTMPGLQTNATVAAQPLQDFGTRNLARRVNSNSGSDWINWGARSINLQPGWNTVGLNFYPDTCTTLPSGTCSPIAAISPMVFRVYYDSSPVGTVDVVNCSSVSGWALEPGDPDRQINVDVYINGTRFDAGATNIYRPDVNAAFGIGNTSAHGYSFAIPPQYKNQYGYTVDVYAINSGAGFANTRIGGGSFGPCEIPRVNATMNCTRLNGTAVFNSPYQVWAVGRLDGVEIGRKQVSSADWNFDFGISDVYRDGQVGGRPAQVEMYTFDGTNWTSLGVLWSGTHSCVNDALCTLTAIPPAFANNVVDVGQAYTISLTMQNNTAADAGTIWKSYGAAGQYRLSLTPASAVNWDVIPSSLVLPPPGSFAPGTTASFTVGLQPKANTNSTIRYDFQMVRDDGSAPIYFGSVCGGAVTPRSQYGPWLRVQNGNTSALGGIAGQSTDGSTRGTRKLLGNNLDINFDTEFLIMAWGGGNRFCSSNAYLLGQGTDVSGCAGSFNGYKFNLQTNQLSTYYDNVATIASSSTCTSYSASNPPGQTVERAAQLANRNPDTLSGNISAPGNCPAYYQSVKPSLDAPLTPTAGRATLMHDGNFAINKNITSTPAGTINYDLAGDLSDIATSVPSLGIFVKGDVTIDPAVTRLDVTIFATGRIITCGAYPGTTGTILGEALAVAQARAQACRQTLVVRGGLYAIGGFTFGRNYYQARGVAVPFTDPQFDFQPVDANDPAPQGKYYGGPAEDIIGNGMNFILTPPGFEGFNSARQNKVTYLEGNFLPRF